MLRKFSVENYKGFKNKITLDLTSVRDYEFNTECIKNGLLNKTLLMGHNGSGKTNLGYALFDIVYTLTDNTFDVMQKDVQSFINGDGNKDYATFSYEFQQNNNIITYEYRKKAPDYVSYEKLVSNSIVIFERKNASGEVFIRDDELNQIKSRVPSGLVKDGSLSVLRYLANNTLQEKDSPISFVMDFVSRMLYFRSTQDGNTFIGFTRSGEKLDQYIINNGLIGDFERFLKENANLNLKLDSLKIPGMPDIFVQKSKNKNIEFSRIASSGTRALELFYYWSKHFEKVSLLFIDEFDAYYHFELSQKVLEQLKKYSNIQVILTSHNTALVSNDLMRPDCYLYINEGKITSFSESTNREIRAGHNLEKMLRNGEFE